jgi:hypothetical protein
VHFLNLTILETRMLRVIEVSKIFKGYDYLDPSELFVLRRAYTRDHSLKLVKARCCLHIKKFFICTPYYCYLK